MVRLGESERQIPSSDRFMSRFPLGTAVFLGRHRYHTSADNIVVENPNHDLQLNPWMLHDRDCVARSISCYVLADAGVTRATCINVSARTFT